MTYCITESGAILRLEDKSFIPADERNVDYQAYLVWLGEGGLPSLIRAEDCGFNATA